MSSPKLTELLRLCWRSHQRLGALPTVEIVHMMMTMMMITDSLSVTFSHEQFSQSDRVCNGGASGRGLNTGSQWQRSAGTGV